MNIYNKMLVVADIHHDEQPALVRAIQLAKASTLKDELTKTTQPPCHITFFLSIYDVSYEMTSLLSIEERDAMRASVINQKKMWMKEIATPLIKATNIDFSIKVVWHNRPYEAIIAEIYHGDFDLLIKGTRKHDALESVIFTPTDWHLLRKSPSPVLLVKKESWPENATILASVHVTSENETHLKLNDAIIAQLNVLAPSLNATPYLVNAYPMTPANITIELPEFDPHRYTDSVRGYHLTSMKALRQKYGFSEKQTIVQAGLPEEVVPLLAKQLNAGMVILGTSGRTGLSAVFIGNTAEQMIDKMNCDVLALKPDGFIGPLDPY